MENNMDYKKKYEATLQTARWWIADGCSEKEKIALEAVFPELREDEDERMRKAALEGIEYLERKLGWDAIGDTDILDVKEYLEKSKKHTPAGPELKVPNWVHGGWDDEYMINTVIGRYSLHAEVAKKRGDTHDYNLSKSMENWLRSVVKPLIFGKQKEQKPVHTAKEMWKEMRLEVYAQASGNRHEPTYSDDSTKMFSLCDIDEIFEKIGNSTVGSQPAEWSEEDKMNLNGCICSLHQYGYMTYADFLRHLPERFKSLRPQSKWKPSEDEERLINTSISFLKDFADKGYENAVECIDWLKSKLNGNTGK